MLLLPLLLASNETRGDAGDTESRRDSLAQEIADLRGRGGYDAALAAARTLLELERASSPLRAHDVQDAEMLVSTLEHVLSLPPARREELAEADSLAAFIEGRLMDGAVQEAESAARRQLAIRREFFGEEHPETAESMFNLSSVLYYKGRYDEASELAQRVADVTRGLMGEGNPKLAMALGALALYRTADGDLDSAEPLLREALAIDRNLLGPDHPDVASLLDQLAALESARGRHEAAISHHREALRARWKTFGTDHPDVALNLNNLAYALCNQGEYAEAEPLYREALAIQRRVLGPENPETAHTLDNIGYLLHVRGDLVGAERHYREALAAWRKALGPAHPSIAKALCNVADVLRAQGESEAPETLFREALAMYEEALGAEHPVVAATLARIARLLHERGDHFAAEGLYRRALAMREILLGPEHPDIASSLEDLARLRRDEGRADQAEGFYARALEMRLNFLDAEHPSVVQNRTELGRLLLSQGALDAAGEHLRAAATAFEAGRVRVGTGIAARTILDSPYQALAWTELRLGRRQAAWEAAEGGQARALADLLVTARGQVLDPLDQARQDSLLALLGGLEDRVTELERSARHAAPGGRERRILLEARRKLADAQAGWSALQREIASRSPVTQGKPFPIERIQAALEPAAALIGWLDAPAEVGEKPASWAYVIRESGPVQWIPLGSNIGVGRGGDRSADGGADPVRAFRNRVAAAGASLVGAPPRTESFPEAARIWEERFAPLDPLLVDVAALVIVPSGPMLGLPVEALPDGEGRFLGDRYRVSYAPSGTVYAWLREREEGPAGPGAGGRCTPALIVGDPPLSDVERHTVRWDDGRSPAPGFSASIGFRQALRGGADSLAHLPRLLWSRQECSDLAAILGEADLLLGPEASEQRLARLAASGDLHRYRTIHLATHALVDDEQPERSAIVLALTDLPDRTRAALEGDRIYDGLVTAREIVRGWRLDADLVTLSACETALGKNMGGEGTIGLAHAFLQCGARSMLVSLWSVNDQATALLMRRFYENWTREAGPASKAEALREAKQWLRRYTDREGRTPFAHQFYWAPFILLGDPG